MSTTNNQGINAKYINTRIKNKVDLYDTWRDSTGVLLDGEIAIARIKTGETYNPITEVNEPSWELLMKVGDGEKSFNDLPWLSAKASDVYNWAKGATAEGVQISIANAGTAPEGESDTVKSLARWINILNTGVNTNAEYIADINEILKELTGDGENGGSIAEQIQEAIDKLEDNLTNNVPSAEDYQIVKALKLTAAGTVEVVYGKISENELPKISTDKIYLGTLDSDNEQSLTAKLTTIDEELADLEDKIGTDLGNAIKDLKADDPEAVGTSYSFIATAKQTNGVIEVTKASLPEAVAGDTENKKGIVSLGVSGGAATFDSIFSEDKVDGTDSINTRLTAAEENIADIYTEITGGVHFIGTVTAKPETGRLSVTKDGTTTEVDAEAGDIVVWAEKHLEYIYTGADSWEELGDPSGLGAMIDALDYNGGDSGTNLFVTKVTQENGKIAVTYGRPNSTNITHGDESTVEAELGAHAERLADIEGIIGEVTDVADAIESAINDLNFTSPDTSGDTTDYQFIDTISLTNGEFSVTKKAIPEATADTFGIVKLSDAVDNSSGTADNVAATPKAVKIVQDDVDQVEARLASVEDNYVKFVPEANSNDTRGTLRVGATETDLVLIFDCGSASDLTAVK